MSSQEDTIALALLTKTLPPGITAIMVEASKTLSLGSAGLENKWVLNGKIYLREGIPNGTECTTTPIIEEMPGNRFRTKNSTYLVQWAKEQKRG